MLVIGLTGGIASGKSVVAQELRTLGIPVFDADQAAREVVEPGQPAWHEVVKRFGPEILLPDGTLKRLRLGAIIFSDPQARSDLNAITHPRVKEKMMAFIEDCRREGRTIAVLEVPLLLEAGLQTMVDEVWVLKVPEKIQVERLMARNGLSREEAWKRVRAQMPLQEKLAHAHRVIDTGGSVADTREQVQRIIKMITGRNSKGEQSPEPQS